MKPNQNKVIVVEGNHDKARIQSIFPDVDIVITNGREISVDTLQDLLHLNRTRGLVLMLDPDVPGEKIRKTVNDWVGPTEHVFLPKSMCTDRQKGKVGIEHAPLSEIKKALSVHVLNQTNQGSITNADLHTRGLIGQRDSSARRQKVCDALGIGLANGKTLLNKLNMFNIDLTTIDRVME